MNEKLLQVKDLTKYYASDGIVTKALNGITFDVLKGEFTAIMGASGSGKSTLLNIIATIDKPSSGEVTIDGNSISEMKEKNLAAFRRDKLGFIFQDYNLLDTLTGRENIALPLQLKKEPTTEIDRKVAAAAKNLGIVEQLYKFPSQMSGGQRQRIACARAMVTQPAIILADEPTGALDSANSTSLMKTFCKMNTEFNATLLMVTHDAAVGSWASRVLFLRDGKIWNEIVKGTKDQRAMYAEILSVISALGGEDNAR